MSNLEWEKQQIEALYTAAEDMKRFAPWESDIAPFVLMDASQPDKKVLVVFEEDQAQGMFIRFILSPQGIRAWLQEEAITTEDYDDALPSIEEMVNSYEGDYLEVGFHTTNPNNFEKHMQGNHPDLITFRRQRPSCRLETINRRWDYTALLTYLKQTMKVLRLQLAEDSTNADFRLNTYSDHTVLQTACFAVDDTGATHRAPFTFGKGEMLRLSDSILDEFSNARVKHLPPSQKMYELFYFYLPTSNAPQTDTLPLAVFLVDLDSGLIEWNDVYFDTEKLPEVFLRHLWQHFIDLGVRPNTIFMQSLRSYCSVAKDMARAGISPQYIEFSYVGQELFDSYVETMHLKEHQLFADRFPREPY